MKTSVEYAYTRRGQLAGKYLGGKLKPDAAVEYEYAKDGQIVARTANGVRQTYEYDFKGQLLGVKEGEEYVERYAYDKAGNMTKKTVGGKTTTFTFDDANQLVSSTTDGITTRYEYDAAGRLVREGNKTYTYGYLDKVMSVRDGKNKFTYTYHPDGQLATADYGKDGNEDFTWDGLALIQRGNEHFINEPHVGGGNPVVSSKGTSYFNDMLGTTVGAKSGKQYSAATLSAFGEDLTHHCPPPPTFSTSSSFFTGKPAVAGLGHAFLMRNYRASLGKWQTADPMGYPDGWNALAYCNNGVTSAVDLCGCFLWNPFDWFGDKGKFIDSEVKELSGMTIIILEVQTVCGDEPPAKSFKWSVDGGKFNIKGKINIFGIDFDLSYESASVQYEYCPEKYRCDAKEHNHTGIKSVQIRATPKVQVRVDKYWRKGADENTPEDERYVYSVEAIGNFWKFETTTVVRTNCE